MTSVSGANLNSAFLAGQYGLQNASDGITQAASNIAQRTVESNASSTDAQANASSSVSNGNLTNDLIALNVNSTNAQASARVLDVANETVGTIIDILA
ncbi:hypothetical protein LHL20_00175 [Alteromonas sp. McT4-15]|uniref:hypothetical protein n=1 Tax=Alteromonas sp. McT4-15 TaxID=2881256 RepID=UPI0012E5FB65|nr:hypothetical protein [Alteromonas sp. McT4-15]MCB4434651.1 hypothetical protein [Alteromonas sp. McT4-15]MEC8230434.1 hypothetical protein [Pseudomonadota bacterium]GFD89303.1 hypothetical protein KUL152_15290 [Tenacibaculum sp. KUL152]